MTDRELMQKALDVLKIFVDNGNSVWVTKTYEIKEALRTRLAQPEPEPVAYMDMYGQVYNPHELNGELHIKYVMKTEDAPRPLYYAPINAWQWQWLTEKEINKASHYMFENSAYDYSFQKGAEWAATELKRKNTYE